MSAAERVYGAATAAAGALLPAFARGEGKLAHGIRGRGGVVERFRRWAATERELSRPLVWFHAPSVGEGLQARAVMEAFRRRRPDAQVVYTYFSPSAEAFARTVPADFADYLPWDAAANVRPVLRALRPDVIAFSKTDVWPMLSREAARCGTRMALLSATLPAHSTRLAWPARALLAPAYGRLHRVAAITPADAERFARLAVPPTRRGVMGDARFDQVWRRATETPAAPWLQTLQRGFAGNPVIVAGSTWPEDEARLLPAIRALRGAGSGTKLVLVPHEPTAAHLQATEAHLDRFGLPHLRLSAVAAPVAPLPPVLLVDRVGVLGDLYALADVAYVGGGFGSAGLHSVLEPAAFGAPVLFGPHHHNAREAAELVAVGGGAVVENEADLQARLSGWFADAAARREAGDAARAYVENGRGAAERGAAVVEALLDTAAASLNR